MEDKKRYVMTQADGTEIEVDKNYFKFYLQNALMHTHTPNQEREILKMLKELMTEKEYDRFIKK
jgi:hypothetical protein